MQGECWGGEVTEGRGASGTEAQGEATWEGASWTHLWGNVGCVLCSQKVGHPILHERSWDSEGRLHYPGSLRAEARI